MKNFQQRGNRITFPATAIVGSTSGGTTSVLSGDACSVGRICGVAVANATPGTAGPYNDGNVVLELEGVFNLSVQSIDHAIAAGETVYISSAATAVLSDISTGMPFGIALDAVGQYATAVVRVKLFGITPGTLGATTYES